MDKCAVRLRRWWSEQIGGDWWREALEKEGGEGAQGRLSGRFEGEGAREGWDELCQELGGAAPQLLAVVSEQLAHQGCLHSRAQGCM